MTEEEAKKTMCPIFVHGFQISSTLARTLGHADDEDINKLKEASVYCQASKCQCWVPQTPHEVDDNGEKVRWVSGGHCGAVK